MLTLSRLVYLIYVITSNFLTLIHTCSFHMNDVIKYIQQGIINCNYLDMYCPCHTCHIYGIWRSKEVRNPLKYHLGWQCKPQRGYFYISIFLNFYIYYYVKWVLLINLKYMTVTWLFKMAKFMWFNFNKCRPCLIAYMYAHTKCEGPLNAWICNLHQLTHSLPPPLPSPRGLGGGGGGGLCHFSERYIGET